MVVYADNAATTTLNLKAKRAMIQSLDDYFGNPSSSHFIGQEAYSALMHSRRTIAKLLRCNANEIIFTSGGTESNNFAILSAAQFGKKHGCGHIISSQIEHHSVLHVLEKLQNEGVEVTLVPADKFGTVRPQDVKSAIKENTCLVSVMYANNEVGTIQPIQEIAEICHSRGVCFHTDAVQAVGHLDIDVSNTGADMLSASAHKFGGPKGIGFLYCKAGTMITPLIFGGQQENGLRAGTENLPSIIGMSVAFEQAMLNREKNEQKIDELMSYLVPELLTNKGAFINGDRTHGLKGTINICFPGTSAEAMLLYLSNKGICVSAGSACNSDSIQPSHVLMAMCGREDWAKSSIRISLSENNTVNEMQYLAKEIKNAIRYSQN